MFCYIPKSKFLIFFMFNSLKNNGWKAHVIRFQSRTLFVQELNKLETLRKKFLGVFYLKFLRNLLFKNFLETNKQAELFKIFPSVITLKLFAFNVDPVDVISVMSSAEPVNGYDSVAPRLGIILN